MKKTFLVTGASGFLGYNLCRYLLKKGQNVVGVDLYDFNYPEKSRIKFFKGDIRDKDLLKKVMKNVDVVVHGAAALPLWPRKDIFSTNVDGTRNILEEAFKAGVDRVIYISSTSVYGIPKVHPVDEDAPLVGVGPYGESKIKAEKVCLEFRKRGYCVPIIRPKTFSGPFRLGVFQILCDWVMRGKNIPIVGSGKNKYQLLHVDDLLDAIYLTSIKPKKIVNDTFNIGATEFDSMKGDLQKLLDYAGFGKRVIPIPSIIAIPTLKLLEYLRLSPLYEWVYETADVDHYVSVEKAQKVLGWKPKYSTAEVWIDTYKWYLKHYKEYEGKSGVTHRVPWNQGILSLVRLFF
ncbi:MAG: NAD-dependent epimerase/dehydratase family protein [Candidatus Aenigmarchaeota archaeon]|nr:NAD-dependent epimerase/dehydratase family protein [Candidatus Aenigmarchaeota archaeon]